MNAKMPSIRFRIDFAEDANLGPGKIALLEAIQAGGSLSDAARSLGMSYRRAWLLLDNLNRSFDKPVAVSTVGGSGGGGAQVTSFGVLLIERYRRLEREISQVSRECLKDIVPRMARPQSDNPPVKRIRLAKKPRS
jgi:molybdate transport system regulatory protein